MSLALARRIIGDGPPLVIVHGLFGQGRNWQSVARRLAAAWRVCAVDLRNHGDSPWTADMTLEAMADDLRAVLEAEGLAPATVLGHSLGGKVAMVLALRQPERVDSLVAVDIAPVSYDHTFLPQIRAMQAVDLRFVDRRADVDAVLADVIGDAAERAFLAQNLKDTADGLAWQVNLEAIARNMANLTGFPDLDEAAFDGRVLFIRGERSDYIATSHHDAIFQLFPQAEFAVVGGAGHRPHAERPDAFLEVVSRFLESGTA